jgi:ribosomal protein S18 acetylase RimI-like enzyme
MPLQIRSATDQDIGAVRNVLVETWHATYDAFYGADKVEEITSRWHAIDALTQQLALPKTAYLVADRDGQIIATSLAREMEPGLVLLSRIYVLPSEQGRGTGTRLLQKSLAAFPSAKTVRLQVDPNNVSAIRFYERHGFKRAGEVKDCGESSGVDALIYERRAAA